LLEVARSTILKAKIYMLLQSMQKKIMKLISRQLNKMLNSSPQW